MEMETQDDSLLMADDVISLVAKLDELGVNPNMFLDLTALAVMHGLSHELETLIINAHQHIAMNDADGVLMMMHVHRGGIRYSQIMLETYPSLVQTVDYNNRSVFHLATANCDIELCQLLHKYGADVNQKDVYELTPLHYMIHDYTDDKPFSSVRDIIVYLKSIGGLLEVRDITGCTALVSAITSNNIALIDLLISLGAETDTLGERDDSLLLQACRTGNVHTCKHVIDYLKDQGLLNCTINKYNYYNETPLYIAVSVESVATTLLLLENGANVNPVYRIPMSNVLDKAVDKQNLVLVKILIEHGANVNSPYIITMHGVEMKIPILFRAMQHLITSCTLTRGDAAIESQDIFNFLLQCGSCITDKNDNGENIIAMLLAGVKQCPTCGTESHVKIEWLQSLIDKCPDISITHTLLGGAFFSLREAKLPESLSFGTLLCTHGVNINQLNSDRNTLLVEMTKRGNQHMIYTLIRLNADVNLSKPIVRAVLFEKLLVCKMLYLAGCNMNPVSLWMDDKGVLSNRIPVKNNELREWVEIATSQPQPLFLMCRRVIRNVRNDFDDSKIDATPLPTSMKEFLKFNDIHEMVLI